MIGFAQQWVNQNGDKGDVGSQQADSFHVIDEVISESVDCLVDTKDTTVVATAVDAFSNSDDTHKRKSKKSAKKKCIRRRKKSVSHEKLSAKKDKTRLSVVESHSSSSHHRREHKKSKKSSSEKNSERAIDSSSHQYDDYLDDDLSLSSKKLRSVVEYKTVIKEELPISSSDKQNFRWSSSKCSRKVAGGSSSSYSKKRSK